ncbi:hypothetical protein LTR53_013267 [Teratosphaeriaceae sp. CCFEE 6253]|nr:hypothetical protein LTR53_013267 [Teratosphaeriaceae sp. CCFEE 6253]
MSNQSADGDMGPEFHRFEELPPELKGLIMGYVALSDRIAITSKTLRLKAKNNKQEPVRYVSKFMPAFCSTASFPAYVTALRESILKDKNVVHVAIKDYNFTNFQAILGKMQQGQDGIAALQRFCFVPSAAVLAFDSPELVGPNFRLHLYFTPGFTCYSHDNLLRYLGAIQKLQKKCGHQHFRVFYEVGDAVGSPALNEMIGGLGFDGSARGQFQFLMAALKKYLSWRTLTEVGIQIGDVPDGRDINAGDRVRNVEEDEQVYFEELREMAEGLVAEEDEDDEDYF